ncbi:glycosyltransferase family 2 protein [Mariniflexile sp.]|uniref:glycosyltransferase family 2 protein n=1 Tax=Mariniflexile sp. TaxID=1979402 RepID=UPI0040479776
MEKLPLVSVVMITYGHEKFIEEAVNSVLMQECDFHIELILANDASPDKTDSVIQHILKSHPRASSIHYFKHVHNIGMMPNFIFALQQTKSKYIALCEGDDYWTYPLKLQKQVDFLESNEKFSGCFHNTMLLDEREINLSLKPWRVYNKDVFTLEDTISTTALFHTSSFMFRNINLKIPEWFKKVQSGDMALFSLLASKGLLYRINEFMSVYRKNEAGITNFIKIKEYHENRIKLNLYFKNSFGVSNHKKIDEVIKYHTSELSKVKSGFFYKLKSLIKF